LRRARRLSIEELSPYLLPVPPEPAPLDWRQLFGNGQPVEIEVGFGKGLFLLTAALALPGVNFVGVEIARKYQLYAATRIAKRELKNVRLAKADARFFLRDYVALDSCQAVHVYFPDPWWKKRHLKRRVFTDGFARQCERVLRSGGTLQIATDVAEYFAVMTQLVTENTRLKPIPPPDSRRPAHDLDYLTNFERKFRKEGREIYRAVYEKVNL
jgi:tRNA (guanine-N7-)-methyltransferase